MTESQLRLSSTGFQFLVSAGASLLGWSLTKTGTHRRLLPSCLSLIGSLETPIVTPSSSVLRTRRSIFFFYRPSDTSLMPGLSLGLPRVLCGSLAASLALAGQSVAPDPIAAPLRDLKWGQLNFLHTTDTHGWLAGHLQEYDREALPMSLPWFLC